MESYQKVCQMSREEAQKVDPNNVAYYTLTDGTIIHIKNETQKSPQTRFKSVKQTIGQKRQTSTNYRNIYRNLNEASNSKRQFQTSVGKRKVYRQSQNILLNQNQSQKQAQKEKTQQKKTITSKLYIRNKNRGNILQPGDNYGLYISGEKKNYIPKCTCNYQIQNGYINYNAKLVDTTIVDNQMINQLQLKCLIHSLPNQREVIQKRHFYKLVEAIPIIVTNNNTQANFEQYNNISYMPGRSRSQNFRKNLNMNQQYFQNIKKNDNLSKRLTQNMSKYGNNSISTYEEESQENKYQRGGDEFYNNIGFKNSQQSLYCTCGYP